MNIPISIPMASHLRIIAAIVLAMSSATTQLTAQHLDRDDDVITTVVELLDAHGTLSDPTKGSVIVSHAVYVKLDRAIADDRRIDLIDEIMRANGLTIDRIASVGEPDRIAPMMSLGDGSTDIAGRRTWERRYRAEQELARLFVVSIRDDLHPKLVATMLSLHPSIEYAEPVNIPTILSPEDPNDPLRSEQNQLGYVRADEAWAVTPGDSTVVIGVIDAGMTIDHEDLRDNIAFNPGETGTDDVGGDKSSNGIDDDANGFVDDWRGVNMTLGDGQADGDPTNGEHGTQVTGYAAATADNGVGVVGIGNRCRYFPVKAAARGTTRLAGAYPGILYCARRGFKVINCSWGDGEYSQAEQDIVTQATRGYDAAIVAAGGNAQQYERIFPAGYRHVLGVAGVNEFGSVITTWGEQIDLLSVAGMTTSGLDDYYNLPAASSYAAPVVSGVVALARSRWPELTAEQALAHVRLTSVNLDLMNIGREKLIGLGKADAFQAVTVDPFSHPGVIVDSIWTVDAEGFPHDGFHVGEEGRVMIRFRNLLGDATNLRFRIERYKDDSNVVEVDLAEQTIGSLASGETWTTPVGLPFEVVGPGGSLTSLRIVLDADGYADYHYEIIPIHSAYIVYESSKLTWTVTERGRFGYDDEGIGLVGEGVAFEERQHIYEGGVIISTDRQHVVDNVRNLDNKQNSDLRVIYPHPGFSDSTLVFSDSAAIDRIGLEVFVAGSTNETFPSIFVMTLAITNRSAASIGNLKAGLFTDFDLNGSSDFHTVSALPLPLPAADFAATMESGSGTAVIAALLSPSDSPIFTSIDNIGGGISLTDGFSDDEKYQTLANGINILSTGPSDMSMVIGDAFDTLGVGETDTLRVAYAFSNESLDEARDTLLRFLQSLSTTGVTELGGVTPRLSIYPQPSRSHATIVVGDGIDIERIDVVDIVGRIVYFVDGADGMSGPQRGFGTIDLTSLPSGEYLLRVTTSNGIATMPIVVLR